jgi:hypothetical protein
VQLGIRARSRLDVVEERDRCAPPWDSARISWSSGRYWRDARTAGVARPGHARSDDTDGRDGEAAETDEAAGGEEERRWRRRTTSRRGDGGVRDERE